MSIFYLSSKKLYISNRFLWTEEELNEIDRLIKEYKLIKLTSYQLARIFPVKKILAEKETYYKTCLNQILEIERQLTNDISDTRDPIKKTIYICFRDGMIPRIRELIWLQLNKVKKLIQYYDSFRRIRTRSS